MKNRRLRNIQHIILNRICQRPIIKNLHSGELTEDENFSYISNLKANRENEIAHYIENKDPKLKAFIKTLNFYDV